MNARLAGSRASSSLSRRTSSDTGVLLERPREALHRVQRTAHALGLRRLRDRTQVVLPRAQCDLELAATRRGEAQLELHVRVERIRLRGAAQLLGAVGV